MRVLPPLLLLLLSACQPAAPDPRGVAADETLLAVSASGQSEARPDEARISLGVSSRAASSAEAMRLNAEKMNKVTAGLSALGVKPDDLQTRNLQLQRIDYGPERGSFRAEMSVEVRLRDAKRVGEAIQASAQAGANLLSGPDLRVSNREAASRSAYAGAYRAARARAEAYANAAGLKIVRVLAIREAGEASGPGNYARDAMAVGPPMIEQVAAAPPPPFNPGLNTTEVRIRVDFALAPK
jgi:uncharacterized protein